MCAIVFPLWLWLAGRSYQTSENSLFNCGDPFPHDFGQVQAWIIPYLIEMVKVSDIVLCRVVFIFIFDHNQMEEYSNFRKCSFLSCFARWYLFLQVFSRSVCNLQYVDKKWLDLYFSLEEYCWRWWTVLFLWYGWPTKGVQPYFQSLSEILTIANNDTPRALFEPAQNQS